MTLLIAFLTSCRVNFETTVNVSDLLSDNTRVIPAHISIHTMKCEYRDDKRFFLGSVAYYKGCQQDETGSVERWNVDIPFIKYQSVKEISDFQFALYYGKNNSLILYIDQKTLVGLRRMVSKEGSPLDLHIQVGLINDTNLPISIAVSNVWVDGTVAVGQQLSVYEIPPNNGVSISLADTAVGSMLRMGSEPVMIAPTK